MIGTMSKILNLPECIISYEYNIQILIKFKREDKQKWNMENS